ncbi:MAG: hypothetical protein K0Q48_3431 [Bacillota bacterium]|jgi:similar to stage IV sporulation protein|nr:hypothetical protein [Bacillota bacterium]
MKNRGSFLEHSVTLKVEGFEQQKLISECMRKDVPIKDIHIKSDIEMILTLMEWDYQTFLKTAKNKYRITVLRERGYKPVAKKAFGKKSTMIGMILFALILYYQSTFVSEIRIFGYESFTESEIRESLREAGLYEGCSKSVDLKTVKLHLYNDLDNIAWIGVKYIGNLAEVTIAEGTVTPKPVDKSIPCDIVADKEGYVEKTIAREGVVAALPGTYVKPGDVLISGIIPVKSTAYGTPDVNKTERYVHSAGEVYVRVPYRLNYYQEKYRDIKTPTGNCLVGFRVEIGDFKLNTANILNYYDNSVYEENKLLHVVRPIPVSLALVKIKEITVTEHERSQEEIEKEGNRQVREAIRQNLPENVQILNKSLKFSPGENIIGVAIMLEALEKIGMEKEIVIGNTTDRGTENQD